MTTEPTTPDQPAEQIDVRGLFQQLRAMQYRTDALLVIDALEAAVVPPAEPKPEPVERPGDVLLVGRVTGGPVLPEPALAVMVAGRASGRRNPWLLPTLPPERRAWFAREELHDVTPARVVPAAVLEDIRRWVHLGDLDEILRALDALDSLTGGA